MTIHCSIANCSNKQTWWDRLFMRNSFVQRDGRWFCSISHFALFLGRKTLESRRLGLKKTLWKVKLGLLLLKHNRIEPSQLQEALEKKNQSLKKLGEILVESGDITENDLKAALSIQAGVAQINLDPELKIKLKEIIPVDLVREFHFVPFEFDKRSKIISIAVHDTDVIIYLEEFFAKLFRDYVIRFYLEERKKIFYILEQNFSQQIFETNVSMTAETGGNLEMEEIIFRCIDFLSKLTMKEIQAESLDNSIWIKSSQEKYQFDIYITPK